MTLGYRGRLTLLAALAGVLGLAFLSRLFAMQVVGAGTYRSEARKQIAGARRSVNPRGDRPGWLRGACRRSPRTR